MFCLFIYLFFLSDLSLKFISVCRLQPPSLRGAAFSLCTIIASVKANASSNVSPRQCYRAAMLHGEACAQL